MNSKIRFQTHHLSGTKERVRQFGLTVLDKKRDFFVTFHYFFTTFSPFSPPNLRILASSSSALVTFILTF